MEADFRGKGYFVYGKSIKQNIRHLLTRYKTIISDKTEIDYEVMFQNVQPLSLFVVVFVGGGRRGVRGNVLVAIGMTKRALRGESRRSVALEAGGGREGGRGGSEVLP